MTPDEQHAWEVIKAMMNGDRVETFKIRFHAWFPMPLAGHAFDDVRDVIANPHLYRVAKEEQP